MTITNNPEYCDYCLSLMVKISTHHFEVLIQLPCERVTVFISWAFEQREITNQESVLQLFENFEKNIRDGKLAGSLLNEWIPMIFSNILSVYRAAAAKKVPSVIISAIFKLVEAFLDKAENFDALEELYVVPLMGNVLKDCVVNAPNEMPEFQLLLRTIVNKCTGIDKMLKSIFDCHLQEMITKDPEYGRRFIVLFLAVCAHGSNFLTYLSAKEINFVMDSISFTFKHNEKNIVETSSLLLKEILNAFKAPKFENFYKLHFFRVEREILEVLTNTSHCSNLELHALELLQLLLNVVAQRQLKVHFISSVDQVADIFTKPLSQHLFRRFYSDLNLIEAG